MEKEHFEQCIVSREYYKETRLLGAVGFFKRKYLDSMDFGILAGRINTL